MLTSCQETATCSVPQCIEAFTKFVYDPILRVVKGWLERPVCVSLAEGITSQIDIQ